MKRGVSGAIPDYSGLSFEAAVEIQERLRKALSAVAPARAVHTVAGADVAFADANTAVAGFLVFSWPDLALIDMGIASGEVTFPYIPGLLSFREVPVLTRAFSRLSARPDVVFCDGQGIAHPRGMGFACHLGLTLGIPTIGVAKSRLVGTALEPGTERGSSAPLVFRDEVVGSVLRTRDGVKPLFVSPGHMMDLKTAVEMVLAAGRGYRLPEPTRQADALVAKAKKVLRRP